jgi:superfamily I DNA and/or RNA helicase
MICAYSGKEITNPATASDGFTYEKSVIFNYVRKFGRSPLTKESLTIEDILCEDDKEDTVNTNIIDKIRIDLNEYIDVLKQPQNFKNFDDNVKVFINKEKKVSVIFEEVSDENKSIETHLKHELRAAFIILKGINGYFRYENQKLFAPKNSMMFLNKKLEIDDIEIIKYSSYSNESEIKKWLDTLFIDEVVSKPLRLLFGIENEKQNEKLFDKTIDISHLNEQQKKVIDEMKELNVIEGPPGTGKTTVISTAVNHIDTQKFDKKHYTVILSEKNKAIRAVIEKFKTDQYFKVLAFGSNEQLDDLVEQYQIDKKIYNHPNIQSIYFQINSILNEFNKNLKKLKKISYKCINKKIHRQFGWDIDFIHYNIRTSNLYRNSKQICFEIIDLLYELKEKYKTFESNFEYAHANTKKIVANDCSIILSTFGSINKVIKFIKDQNEERVSISVIVDEASTVNTWDVLYLEKEIQEIGEFTNLILIGDTKQLPVYFPSNDNQSKESIMDVSLKFNEPIQLKVSYRCPSKIINIINRLYYKNTLISGKKDEKDCISFIHSNGTEDEENEEEANEIIFIIMKFIKIEKEILILSPYKKQVELLQNKIDKIGFANVFVSTIDKSQGNESDIVILSLVKSIPTNFLDAKRSNVMITRTKDKLIVLGNRQNCLKSSNPSLRILAQNKGFDNLKEK